MLKKTFPKKEANFQEMFPFSLKFKNNNSCVYLPGFEPDLNSKKKPMLHSQNQCDFGSDIHLSNDRFSYPLLTSCTVNQEFQVRTI